jgi:hypothetical protein
MLTKLELEGLGFTPEEIVQRLDLQKAIDTIKHSPLFSLTWDEETSLNKILSEIELRAGI